MELQEASVLLAEVVEEAGRNHLVIVVVGEEVEEEAHHYWFRLDRGVGEGLKSRLS